MTITVPHQKTKAEVMGLVDRSANDLFAGAAGGAIQIVNFQKSWSGSTMTFSFAGSFGFVSIPLSGTIQVNDHNVVIECELPPIVRNFIGDEKLGGSIQRKVAGLLSA